jgi:multidrug efflux pump subunit AcrA (membrane-fusion protein)
MFNVIDKLVVLSVSISATLLPAFALAQTPSRATPAQTTMQLGVAATGVIEKIFVRDGDHVDAGQLLVTIDCRPLQAEIRVRRANVAAAEAAYERARNGPRLDEIAIGEANVGVARARAEEAQAAYDRAQELREGISISRAALLQARRDARITAAQLEDQKRRLDLLARRYPRRGCFRGRGEARFRRRAARRSQGAFRAMFSARAGGGQRESAGDARAVRLDQCAGDVGAADAERARVNLLSFAQG